MVKWYKVHSLNTIMSSSLSLTTFPHVSDLGIMLISCFLHLIYYSAFRNLFTEKQRAWLFSLETSAVYSMIAPFKIYEFTRSIYNNDIITLYTHENRFDRIVGYWFLTSLILDCVIGQIDYRRYLRIDTGWIHHITFIIILMITAAHNGSSLLSHNAPLEIPTFILAAGSIAPSLRNDTLFGLTFFIFRILYENVVFYYTITTPGLPSGFILFFYSATMSMHVFWFYKWSRSYCQAIEK